MFWYNTLLVSSREYFRLKAKLSKNKKLENNLTIS